MATAAVTDGRLGLTVASSVDQDCCERIHRAIVTTSCEGCGGCCGRVLPMTGPERARLAEYVRRHGVEPSGELEDMCALLDPSTRRCRAYPARPYVCRAWCSPSQDDVVGTRPGQPCGLRASLAGRFWSRIDDYEATDTWELFGIDWGHS